jgi:hypothetical protein
MCCASSPKWSPGVRRASMPVPSELRLFCLLEQLAGAKTLQLTLKSLNFVRSIMLQVARSSPVASYKLLLRHCCDGPDQLVRAPQRRLIRTTSRVGARRSSRARSEPCSVVGIASGPIAVSPRSRQRGKCWARARPSRFEALRAARTPLVGRPHRSRRPLHGHRAKTHVERMDGSRCQSTASAAVAY